MQDKIDEFIDRYIPLKYINIIFNILLIILLAGTVFMVFNLGFMYGEQIRTEEISQIVNNSANTNNMIKFTCEEFIYTDNCIKGNYYITKLLKIGE